MPVIPQTPRLMPSDPLFDSAWLKWGRAVVHTHALNADIETFGPDGGREPTFSVRAEYQPKRHGFAIIIDDIDALPPTWGLILGDVANNLRSALDQLAWALVTRGRTPPHALTTKQQRNVYYPTRARDRYSTRRSQATCPASGEQTSQRCAGISRTTVAPSVGGLR